MRSSESVWNVTSVIIEYLRQQGEEGKQAVAYSMSTVKDTVVGHSSHPTQHWQRNSNAAVLNIFVSFPLSAYSPVPVSSFTKKKEKKTAAYTGEFSLSPTSVLLMF